MGYNRLPWAPPARFGYSWALYDTVQAQEPGTYRMVHLGAKL